MDYDYLTKHRRLKGEYEAIIKNSKDRRQVTLAKLQLKLLIRKHKNLFVTTHTK